MHSRIYALILLVLINFSSAWLPGTDKTIVAADGTDLFSSSSPASNSSKQASRLRHKTSKKIRGVNLGSLFVFEPWLASSVWKSMGCGNTKSELDCVTALGQTKANSVFQAHWAAWITQDDITTITSYGLNTIRIPIGFWMDESLVNTETENFPQGGFEYLAQVCQWASDAGLYIILDLHGAPGAQIADNPDTGQYVQTPGFYVADQYDRAVSFMSWLTTQIHSNTSFRNVGMLEIVNEPLQFSSQTAMMISSYYPDAYTAIRAAESTLSIHKKDLLHVEMMNSLWGAGNPDQDLKKTRFTAYDEHRYLKYVTSVPVSQSSYLSASCNAKPNSDHETPTVVGEFSLSPPDNVSSTSDWDTSTTNNTEFYKNWFAAQVTTYEKHTNGWVFWTWKSQLNDYRWSYSEAVTAGVIPTDLDDTYMYGSCDAYSIGVMSSSLSNRMWFVVILVIVLV
ncbi:putative endo-beta-1,6-glucanase-1 [Coleophoma cylindrospora]|uniref:glucan endo-1,6-beta-glucosidase n=1 Tax=Coleophoma cylindrospora TaxID=1849047 RepID=A0A3D8RMZ6_9HELO|nr:putative endo-beta-1,6-glucanase-1 [Coleophoma cylindrospora]